MPRPSRKAASRLPWAVIGPTPAFFFFLLALVLPLFAPCLPLRFAPAEEGLPAAPEVCCVALMGCRAAVRARRLFLLFLAAVREAALRLLRLIFFFFFFFFFFFAFAAA